MRFNKSLKRPLNFISSVLAYEYSKEDILSLFKELYPFEWNVIVQRYKNYKDKDKFLVKVKKKTRYIPEQPEEFFFNLEKVKHILSTGSKRRHRDNFDETNQREALKILRKKRKNIILKRNTKINKSLEKVQVIEPYFIDIFISSYHKKGTTTKDKIEILKELKKYKCEKSLVFFYKLNDSERNNQLRNMAFKYLQDTGNYVKLRKKFKGKTKSYMTEKDNFFMKPKDLVEKIKTDSIQNQKEFDFFISHSYKDNNIIVKIKEELNHLNYTIYCDWMSDNDFLRRSLASDYTKIVLKKRIEQSRNIIFVRTENTNDSKNNLLSEWVQMELDYSIELDKKILCIDLLNDGQCKFELMNYDKENNTLNITK